MMEKMSVSEITDDSKIYSILLKSLLWQLYLSDNNTIVENEKTARIPAGSFG